ncbi:MAG TPA: hypothetical protein PK629_11740 [Oscillospiraceae bacterium]|nr:hypothetical protein [Oscillospiraceae bacterium]HPK36352.1 hypothetical protein [Oscillospiraceae bacterium]HPR76703.1 hypothetical protein [Oscillospiraceae bacterium]
MKRNTYRDAMDTVKLNDDFNDKTIAMLENETKPARKLRLRPALALACFALASILVITAAAAGGVQLFSLLYRSDVSAFESYFTEATTPINTENVSFTLESVVYDGYTGQAFVSMKALSEIGTELINQFNTDLEAYSKEEQKGSIFWPEKPDYKRAICNHHMIIAGVDNQQYGGVYFAISLISEPIEDDKCYYLIEWDTGNFELPEIQIGWTDNNETVLTDFDLSATTSNIVIDCSTDDSPYPELTDATEIIVSPLAVYISTRTSEQYVNVCQLIGALCDDEQYYNDSASVFVDENEYLDDLILVKYTNGEIYDLFGSDEGEYKTLPLTDALPLVQNGRNMFSYSEDDENGVRTYCRIDRAGFNELTDLSEVESIIFMGVEYKLH